MEKYDVIVIGAGNGGLTGALTLAKAGKKVLLIERHNVPGGCATSFIRGRFEFEVSLHQLSGLGTESQPGPIRMLLQGLGVMDKIEPVLQHEMYRTVVPGEVDIVLKSGKENIVRELQSRFPEEKQGIQKFFDLLFDFGAQVEENIVNLGQTLSPEKHPLLFEYSMKSADEVMNEYISDPRLKIAVSTYWTYFAIPPSRFSFLIFALTHYIFMAGPLYHLKGGSQSLSNALASEIAACGGEIKYNTAVTEILVKDNQVKGVITGDGTQYKADRILSNASMISTYIDMIPEEHVPGEVFSNLKISKAGPSICSLYMGFDCPPEELGIKHATNFIQASTDMDASVLGFSTFDKPKAGLLSCYNIDDPDFSPDGTCVASLATYQNIEHWIELPPHKYHEKKFEFAQKLLDFASAEFPNLKDHIEEIEISTPVTHLRYLGHQGGTVYGFDNHIKDFMFNSLGIQSPVKGLFFAGSWTTTGGFQPTLFMGHAVANMILQSMVQG